MSLVPWRHKQRDRELAEPQPSHLESFRDEMDHLFERFFSPMVRSNLLPSGFGDFFPHLDISETADELCVEAEIPGIDPKDLDISVTGDVLTIKGEKRESKEEKTENFHRTERRFGTFHRRIELPAGVDTDSIAADYKKGVLTLRMKKTASAVSRRIAVSSG